MGGIRKAAVAGMFYPGSKSGLLEEVERCLAGHEPVESDLEDIFGLVVPHAGYAYSGRIAGVAYNHLTGRQYDTVVLLGPTHRVYFEGASVSCFEKYQTPLGDIEVDTELAEHIIASSQYFSFVSQAHSEEHSLEVQLPFLQTVLQLGFRIVPIVFGSGDQAMLDSVAKGVFKQLQESNKKILFVCSTDLSHDYPYDQAVQMDQQVAEKVEALDADGLMQLFDCGKSEACGARGLITLLKLAKLAGCSRAEITSLANSGDVVGDKQSRIVGYLSAIMNRNIAGDIK